MENMISALLLSDSAKVQDILNGEGLTTDDFSIIEKHLVPALVEIGRRWEVGQVALAQVYMSGVIAEKIVQRMSVPNHAFEDMQENIALVVLEDKHSLGKRMASSVLRASGFQFIDYGVGMSVEEVAERVEKDNINILLVSTLMLRAALRVKELRKKLDRRSVKIIVGGAPFLLEPGLWKDVGADAMAKNTNELIEIIKNISNTEG